VRFSLLPLDWTPDSWMSPVVCSGLFAWPSLRSSRSLASRLWCFKRKSAMFLVVVSFHAVLESYSNKTARELKERVGV